MPPRISSLLLSGVDRVPPSLVPPDLRFAIVESPAEIRLLDLASDPLASFLHWDRGVAFGHDSELRWHRRTAGLHLVRISDSGATIEGATAIQGLNLLDSSHTILTGKWDAEAKQYLEGRIPSPLPYPSGLNWPRLRLGTRNYSFAEHPSERPLVRCVSLGEEYPK